MVVNMPTTTLHTSTAVHAHAKERNTTNSETTHPVLSSRPPTSDAATRLSILPPVRTSLHGAHAREGLEWVFLSGWCRLLVATCHYDQKTIPDNVIT